MWSSTTLTNSGMEDTTCRTVYGVSNHPIVRQGASCQGCGGTLYDDGGEYCAGCLSYMIRIAHAAEMRLHMVRWRNLEVLASGTLGNRLRTWVVQGAAARTMSLRAILPHGHRG